MTVVVTGQVVTVVETLHQDEISFRIISLLVRNLLTSRL